MPTVINGVGTWYYGKRNIHRAKATCSFCQNVGELESYDTTLYFVVVFVPLIPLSQQRILEQCPRCQKHRVISLSKWEASKSKDVANVLEKLGEDPDNRENIQTAIGLAVAYQDQTLFDKLVPVLAGHRRDDAAIQAQLGGAYGYFARWPEAEEAYQASLSVDNNPEIRQQLALALLKQGRPEEAKPYLTHILEQKQKDNAGMIYLLIEGYQAQGMHQEALELIDRRDEAFPDWAESKEYKKQRQLSNKYAGSGQKVKSAFLSESSQVGYREGNWTARLPRYIGPLVVLGLLAWYLIAAVRTGQARKIYFVNGRDKAYTVAVNGDEQKLPAGSFTAVAVPEGEVTIESRDPQMRFETVTHKIETPFFSRPFLNRTFVINPDQLALLLREQIEYAEVPRAGALPHEIHTGNGIYTFDGLDYEFVDFPKSMKVKKGQTVHKSRIALLPAMNSEARLHLVTETLDQSQQIEYAKHWLATEPNDQLFLYWLLAHLPQTDAIAFLSTRLADRPVRVDWHRAYQSFMERQQPDKDLRPEYRQLAQETKDQPDSLYLLGRLLDLDETDALYQKAAAASPPSSHAVHALGWRALSRGQFEEALNWMTKAKQLAPNDLGVRQDYHSVLWATKSFDQLLGDASVQESPLANVIEQLRVYAAKGDKAKARAMMTQATQVLQKSGDPAQLPMLMDRMDMILCCSEDNAKGFLDAAQRANQSPFQTALLQDKLQDAAGLIEKQHEGKVAVQHGLLFLAATKAKDQKLADSQWLAFLGSLMKSDRHDRQLADILAGKQPMNATLITRLPIETSEKRVFLAAAARRFPEQQKTLMPLARKLDFQHDATSLCLQKLLK